MWTTNRYLDLPQVAANYPGYFRSILVYDPPSSSNGSNGIRIVSNTLSISANAIWIELPRMFSLIAVSQIQISAAGGYGELSVQTTAAHQNRQRLILTQGSRYKQDIQPEECIQLRQWRDKTAEYIINSHASI